MYLHSIHRDTRRKPQQLHDKSKLTINTRVLLPVYHRSKLCKNKLKIEKKLVKIKNSQTLRKQRTAQFSHAMPQISHKTKTKAMFKRNQVNKKRIIHLQKSPHVQVRSVKHTSNYKCDAR